MYKHYCMMCLCATKSGSTVRSEFAYYVPRPFNHTHVPYFSSIFEVYRTYIGWYVFLSTVPSINLLKLINNDPLMTYVTYQQRWSRGHKARGQGQGQGHKKNPRPRPRPRTAFPRTNTLEAKDRNARGQGQGPRTQSASALQKKKKKRSSQKFFRRSPKKKKKKKKVFTKIFQAISTKKRFPKNFSSAPQHFNIPKNSAVLEPRTGQFSRT